MEELLRSTMFNFDITVLPKNAIYLLRKIGYQSGIGNHVNFPMFSFGDQCYCVTLVGSISNKSKTLKIS